MLKGKAAKLGYIITEEEVGTSVPFLDTTVSIIDQTVHVKPYVKPNALYNVPLSTASAHAVHVHSSWPRAQMSTKIKISSKPEDFRNVANQLCSRFQVNHIPVPSIFAAAVSTPEVVVDMLTKVPSVKMHMPGPQPYKQAKAYWFVLPYHSAWQDHIRKALKSLNQDPEVSALHAELWGTDQPPIRAAWKNSSPHLEAKLRTATADIVTQAAKIEAVVASIVQPVTRITGTDSRRPPPLELPPRQEEGAAEAAVVVARPSGPHTITFVQKKSSTPRKAIRHKFKW